MKTDDIQKKFEEIDIAMGKASELSDAIAELIDGLPEEYALPLLAETSSAWIMALASHFETDENSKEEIAKDLIKAFVFHVNTNVSKTLGKFDTETHR